MLVTDRGIFHRLELGPFHGHEVNPLLSSPLGNRVILTPIWNSMKWNSLLSTFLAIIVVTAKHDTSVRHLRSWVSVHLKNHLPSTAWSNQNKLSIPEYASQSPRPMPFSRHATFRSFGATGVDKNTRHWGISNGRTFFWRKNAIIHIYLIFYSLNSIFLKWPDRHFNRVWLTYKVGIVWTKKN